MPRMSESARIDSFSAALKRGEEITWEEIIKREDVIGGELGFFERDFYYKGIISKIEIQENKIAISCSSIKKTEIDEDGDAVGEYRKDAWEPANEIKFPVKFSIPKQKAKPDDEIHLYSAIGVFASENWAVRNPENGIIEFCGGSGKIFPKGFSRK